MHGAIRAAGFSVMTMFVSCGVGAQDLDARTGQVTLDAETPTHVSAPPMRLAPGPASQGRIYKPGKTDNVTTKR
ncbi:hypothetical protein EKG40_11560 [Pseudomonas moorei]|nr:hypothetical protein EKG40_11560 [Pseudomonas moorei]